MVSACVCDGVYAAGASAMEVIGGMSCFVVQLDEERGKPPKRDETRAHSGASDFQPFKSYPKPKDMMAGAHDATK